MAFYRKFRAKTFGEMIGQDHVILTLLEAVKSGKLVHAYLLTGPRGIGKTSTARLLAKVINCENIDKKSGEPCNNCPACLEINDGRAIDVIEIDAASHTGVDDIREVIDKIRLVPVKMKKKVYIIDEVHMLSKSAFNALLKTLEEPPEHVVIIMATTEVHKIPATILSRVQRFDFRRASADEIIENLKKIAKAEKIDIDDESLDLIAVSAAGGHRDAIGLLEQVSSQKSRITLEITRKILGIAEQKEIFDFIKAVFNSQPEEGLKIVHSLFEAGYDLAEFDKGVIEKLRQIMLCQIVGDQFLEDTGENKQTISLLSQKISEIELIRLINIFVDAGAMLKDVSYPLLPLEMAVVKAVNHESKNIEHGAKVALTPIDVKPSVVSDNVSNNKTMKQSDNLGQAHKQAEVVNDMIAEKSLSTSTSSPVPVLEMTKDIWQQIIEKTKNENATLAALLRDAKPAGMTDDTISLSVKFKFHKDRISETKNCQLLEKIVDEVTGVKYRIICKIGDEPAAKSHGNIAENPDLKKTVEEVFEV